MNFRAYHSDRKESYWRPTEEQLLPPTDSCPICKSASRWRVASVMAAPAIWLMGCQHCKAASVSRMPREESLKEWYANYYSDWTGPGSEKVTLEEPERLARRIAKQVRNSGDVCRILDFGGGDGSISRLVAEELMKRGKCNGAEILLIEWSENPPAGSKGIHFTVQPEIPVAESGMDIVIASGIIEHIPFPTPTISSLLKMLKKDGLFYARTPYILPFLRLMPSKLPSLFPYPAHLHDLGQHFWNRLLAVMNCTDYELSISRPSIVEVSRRYHLLQWLASGLVKAPWYVFRGWYGFVGGWEVMIHRMNLSVK